jgi:apoptosis-inducing factor 3
MEMRMTEEKLTLAGPDLSQGISLDRVPENSTLLGHSGGEAVLLVRQGGELFAIGATCSHYNGPLADGMVVGETIRCPWHHACFSLRTGEALHAPAFTPVPCWRVEEHNGVVYVREKLAPVSRPQLTNANLPASIVVVGGGAAGFAAAEMLRCHGYPGQVTMLSADTDVPCDRPNLSKDYLAGHAPEEWVPLRDKAFYADQNIDLRLGARVTAIDTTARNVRLADGSEYAYGTLLLATGAEPARLIVPGADLPHVHYLRTVADGRSLIAAAATGKRAVVVGASFIGMEVAAALRTRGLEVHVVAPESRPMERVLGAEIGDMVRAIHEQHGVTFHLGTGVTMIDAGTVMLGTGQHLAADLVVIGIGVRPVTTLAEQAGLATDRGIIVDDYLQTNVPGVFAAGDIARWPYGLTGQRIRIEHWVVAERQGQTAARNMLGASERFVAVPFFWSQHYDVTIAYVGHAEHWDRVSVDGDIANQNGTVTYWQGKRKLAVAAVGRDADSLRAEAEMELQLVNQQ